MRLLKCQQFDLLALSQCSQKKRRMLPLGPGERVKNPAYHTEREGRGAVSKEQLQRVEGQGFETSVS